MNYADLEIIVNFIEKSKKEEIENFISNSHSLLKGGKEEQEIF